MEHAMDAVSVAVMERPDGYLAPLAGDVVVAIYRRSSEGWSREVEGECRLDAGAGLAGMREGLRGLVPLLGTARIVVAREVGGVAVSMLDQRGFRLCGMDRFDAGCLDALCEEIRSGEEEGDVRVPPRPVETDVPGRYVCDLTAILRDHPELSSKKVLRPFLDTTPFVELEVRFGHVPPWLPEELDRRGLSWDDDPDRDSMRIFPKNCTP
ncbi:MAG: hypothetical protein LBR22_08715 [Desulfovibrio sp.]|jgi:hypothetical protein|nr:hypothetical protein [Desulfovibrio sp.]